MKMAIWLLLAMAWALPAHGRTDPSVAPRPTRILFIGNNLTSTGALPERLQKLASAMGRGAVVESITAPGYSLQDHWEEGRAEKAIGKGWDFVVLQQDASARPPARSQLADFARRFARPIRDAGAKPVLYMVWPSSDRMQDFRGAIAAYREAAAAVDGMVVPVGEAWLRALSADKRVRLYGDTIHPAELGVDLAVLTFYFTFFPAGPQEFDDAFVAKLAGALRLPGERRDLLVDAATRAVDEPMALQ
jgi:hypothetical protein